MRSPHRWQIVTAAPLRAARCTGIGSAQSHVALLADAVWRMDVVISVIGDALLAWRDPARVMC
jgi:hypothetical protein